MLEIESRRFDRGECMKLSLLYYWRNGKMIWTTKLMQSTIYASKYTPASSGFVKGWIQEKRHKRYKLRLGELPASIFTHIRAAPLFE